MGNNGKYGNTIRNAPRVIQDSDGLAMICRRFAQYSTKPENPPGEYVVFLRNDALTLHEAAKRNAEAFAASQEEKPVDIATRIKADNAKTRDMLDYVESIDPLNGKNVARYAAQHFTDNGDGTMKLRRSIPFSKPMEPAEKPVDIMAVTRGMCK